MKSLTSIRLVALREIRDRGRSRAYLITSGVTLLLVLAVTILPGVIGDDTETFRIGSLGEGNTQIIDTAELLGNAGDEEGAPPSVDLEEVGFDTREAAEEALSSGDVDAVLVDGSEVVVEREGGAFAGDGPRSLLQQAAGAIALERAIQESGESVEDVVAIMSSDNLETTVLVAPDEGTDEASVAAYFGLLLLYMAIILYGTWILTGVTEEKSNRVVEVIISTIQPWQLLAGKIAGIGALALVQFVGTIAFAYAAVRIVGDVELPEVPLDSLVHLAVWFILGFLLYAVLFGAAGSLVGRLEDAQSAAMPMTIFSVVGFFAGFAVLNDADGLVAQLTTYVPFTAPFTVPIRVSLNAMPAWQYAAAVMITLASIYVAVRVAGRIYSGGILRTGKRTKFSEAWRADSA